MTKVPVAKWRDLGLSYEEAAHGMQTAVAFEMERHSAVSATSPKHLRVGINSAMVEHSALVNLLIKKGAVSAEEFLEELRLAMNDEVARYEAAHGHKISFR